MRFKTKPIQVFAAIVLIATGVFSTSPKPVRADETTTTILIGAAAIAGALIYENVQRKQQAANQIVGYTQQGFPVYADGHVGTSAAGRPVVACPQAQSCTGPYATRRWTDRDRY
jgi:hypothetical protein